MSTGFIALQYKVFVDQSLPTKVWRKFSTQIHLKGHFKDLLLFLGTAVKILMNLASLIRQVLNLNEYDPTGIFYHEKRDMMESANMTLFAQVGLNLKVCWRNVFHCKHKQLISYGHNHLIDNKASNMFANIVSGFFLFLNLLTDCICCCLFVIVGEWEKHGRTGNLFVHFQLNL